MRRLLTVAARRGANRAIAWTRPPSDASSFAASAGLARRLGASDGGDRQLLSRRASTSASGPQPARGKANVTAAAEARRPESEAKAEEAAEAKANATTNADANADANANANADANADATATAAAATKSARDVRRGGPIDEARSGQIVTAHGNAEAVRVTSRLQGGAKQTPYRLRRDLMSDELSRELEDFVKFLTARRLGSVDAPIREVTARKYVDHVLGVFGWMHHHGGRGRYPIEELTSMKLIFPTKERKSAALAFDHLQWLANERKCSANYELFTLRALVAAAKFCHGGDDAENDGFAKPYADVPLVGQLRKISKETMKRADRATPTSDARKKWLAWDQFVAVVDRLREECAPRLASGAKRPARAVAWAYQRYLILGMLSCVPDRGRTFRELQIGRTLFKEDAERVVEVLGEDGETVANADGGAAAGGDPHGGLIDYRWVIRQGPDDYKTGHVYGVRPPMVIHPKFYPALEAFIETHRAALNPKHDYLFTSRFGGEPLTDAGLHRIVTTATFRHTGKRTNPHLIRDMIITHLRGTDASERELEALAIYMGHSMAMQKGTYDRRTKEQKVAPAIDLLERAWSGGGGVKRGGATAK